jgi:hypothetical protein
VFGVCCFTAFDFRQVQLLGQVGDRFSDALWVVILCANAALFEVMAYVDC